jgi:hypothetical protein
MPAQLVLEHLAGSSGTAVAVSALRFRADDQDAADNLAAVAIPALVSTPLMAAVAASGSVQTLTVLNSAGFSAGDYALIAPGTSSQEVAQISAVPSGQTLSLISQNAHNAGAQITLCSASFAKTLRLNVRQTPQIALSRIRLVRTKPLPGGVYDQYQVLSRPYAQQTNTPGANTQGWLPVVLNVECAIAAGPVSASGPMSTLFALQWLYTGSVAPPLDSSAYRILYDEA